MLTRLALLVIAGMGSWSATEAAVGDPGPAPVDAVWRMPTDPRFGAKCDGIADDTAAIQAWAGSASAGAHLRLPAGTCKVTAPIHFPIANAITLDGAGLQSILLYAGADTRADFLTIGSSQNINEGCAIKSWSIHNIRVLSSTQMTDGAALTIGHLCEGDISNVAVGGDLDHNLNWWNGIHFDGGNSIHMRGYFFAARNISEILNGNDRYQLIDLFQTQGKITGSRNAGLNIAGAVGGFSIDQSDILLNGANVVIDRSQASASNYQLFFGPGVAIDVTHGELDPAHPGMGVGVYLNDPGFAYEQSQLTFAGTWLASARAGTLVDGGKCLYVSETAKNWTINFFGGTILNCETDGIRSDSSTVHLTMNGTRIDSNGGYGVYQSVPNPNAEIRGMIWGQHNGRGNLGGYAYSAERLTPNSFMKLPPCDEARAGTTAYVTDASDAITTWHQQVTAGGGSNRAFVACNGTGWFAFGF